MNRLVAQTHGLAPGTHLPPQNVGLFEASNITVTSDGVSFATVSGSWFDRTGFVYRPTTRPADTAELHIDKDDGRGWYSWFHE